MIIGATTTWNNREIVEQCLIHYKKLGMDELLVMDFDSVDGTREVLESIQWSGFVKLLPFPGIEGLDSSNLILKLAKDLYPADSAILFFDPDEFLVTPHMNIVDLVSRNHDDGDVQSSCVIRRFNMTASRRDAQTLQDEMHPFGLMAYQILNRSKRNGVEEMHHEKLSPPWIWSAIPGKVFVNLRSARHIGDGDHKAELIDGELEEASTDFSLLHFPFRSWAEFEAKIEMAKIDMAANAAQLPENYGWQIKRWIRLAEENRLYEEYLEQFIVEDQEERMLQSRDIAKNEALILFHK